MSGRDDLLRNSISWSELTTLREARHRARGRLTEAIIDDRAGFDELDSLWAEYTAANEAYMEAMGWTDEDRSDPVQGRRSHFTQQD